MVVEGSLPVDIVSKHIVIYPEGNTIKKKLVHDDSQRKDVVFVGVVGRKVVIFGGRVRR